VVDAVPVALVFPFLGLGGVARGVGRVDEGDGALADGREAHPAETAER
jgi:hypothetical protein